MNTKLKAALVAPAALLAVVLGGAQIAQANSAADDAPEEAVLAAGEGQEVPEDDAGEEDEQVTGSARDDAGGAALEAAGGGTVTEVEIADEGDSGYEVEVEQADGSFVEVALTDDFEVVSVEEDDD